MRSTRNMKRYQAVKKPAFVSRKVRETNGLERVPSYRQPLKKASYSRARCCHSHRADTRKAKPETFLTD